MRTLVQLAWCAPTIGHRDNGSSNKRLDPAGTTAGANVIAPRAGRSAVMR